MRDFKLKTPEKVEEVIINGYKEVENTSVNGYQAIKDSVVSKYKTIENKFVDTFLEKKDLKQKIE